MAKSHKCQIKCSILFGVVRHCEERSDVATDAAEREQRVLAHFAEPRGGKATNVD